MEASYCLCGQPYDPNKFMIQCDSCKDWFHSSCCNMQEHAVAEIDTFHCPRCTPIAGPSVSKPYKNWHRHDFWDENLDSKPVQTGTRVFIHELRARHFVNESEVVTRIRGQQLTENYLQSHGFNNPIVIDSKDNLDITIPPQNFSVYDVEAFVGGDNVIDVIDVHRQADIKMRLRDFVEYYNSVDRKRVYNVVSLEVSDTPLSQYVEAPLIARKLDWAYTFWPHDYHVPRPQVQKYCLMSVKDSYTDFHIDFGGTSVWYHVLRGEKIFYFIRPTTANLTLYQQWMAASNQSETFFADQVDQCFKCTLRQGQTMLIPTGWIHAVLTPVDSLVFGGNFLHTLGIQTQLAIYDMEKKIHTETRFKYPNFEMINWFAAASLLEQIRKLNAEERKCGNVFLVGLKSLLVVLKQWNSERDYSIASRSQIPETINAAKLIKDISKEVRHAERYINQLNPPKPERESKRKRRKPINKDFVDYSHSSKATHVTLHQTLPEPLLEPLPAPLPAPIMKPPPIKLTLPKPATYPYERSPLTLYQQPFLTCPSERSEETTAVHRGGAVLKFKLGTKDMYSTADINNILHEPLTYSITGSQSIYDFSDDGDKDEYGFMIDEEPKKTKTKVKSTDAPGRSKHKANALEMQQDLPQNGIESLLKASALTNKYIAEPGPGRTSPSTQEAIAGMLSIGQTSFVQSHETSDNKSGSIIVRKRKSSSPILEEENINNVHQDEDYIYPSLDNSDDEDVRIFKPRGRSKVDEAWNPKARVGPLLPKINRPAREGTKKQAVEKVLEAAAAKRATQVPDKLQKRQYQKRKLKIKAAAAADTKVIPSTSSTSQGSTVAASNQTINPAPPRPKKGMKTAKQRLGKILKIHKMIH